MNSRNMLVTGAYGFLGRHVAKKFSDAGWIVNGIGHGDWQKSEWEKWGLSNWNSCSITMDSLNALIKEYPELVIHCAGSGSVEYSLEYPMQDFERTVLTTSHLLEFIRLKTPQTKFIYPSSAAVYGVVEKLPITESTSLNPISPYGMHKKIAEDLIRLYARYYHIPVATVRFFSLYGPGLRKQLLWDVCKKIENGDLNFFGSGYEIRDWLHVTDAANLLFIISSYASDSAPIVNGGSGIGTSVSEVINHVLKLMGTDDKPTFSHLPKCGDPPGYIADIQKAMNLTWKSKIPLLVGIDEYIKWYKSGVS